MLGIETVTESTANWSGRINHFLVHERELYLFKLEVNLPPGQSDKIPKRARKETRTIYLPYHDGDPEYVTICPQTSTFLVFDDLKIGYTGAFIVSFPMMDVWNQPWPIEDECPEPTKLARLEFEKGLLVDQEKLDPGLVNYV